MESIRKQARIARRRLTIERFLRYLPWTLSLALAVAVLGMIVPKVLFLDVDTQRYTAAWLATATVIAFLVNSCLTWIGRPSTTEAAAEIDKRFTLRERLCSAMLLAPEDRETELGQALAADANRRAEQIDVRDQFRWGFHRGLLFPVLPLLLAAAVWTIPNREPQAAVVAADALSITQIKNSTKSLVEQLKKKRLEAEKQGLADAVDMFKKLEGELAKLEKDTKLDTKQSLAKLNDIKQQLEERRKELGSSESLKKNLQNLEKFEAGPADKLASGLKQGDFEKAEEALEQLMEKIKNGEMNSADMQQLQKQLEQLEKSLSEAAKAHEQSKQSLQEQMKQAEAAGDMQKAAQLQQKLEQMQAQDANMAMMQQMADALSQAQQSMQQGDMQAAQEALAAMASQMQQMNQSDAQLQDLDQLMDSLSQSKSQMACKQCNGAGCSSCMGSMPGKIPGNGLGQGRGAGDRPEEEDQVDFFDSRVRDQMKMGETVYGGKVGGENRKGISQIEIQDAVLTSMSEEPEPLDDTPLPKAQHDHARDYFNSIRDGRANAN